MVAPFNNFYCKIWVGFCLNTGKRFVLEVLRPRERAYILLKRSTRDFQNSPPFERSACFYMTTNRNLECFHCFIFETDFLKNKNLFKKLEYTFLVQSANIESAIFPHKSALPEANIKTNRMGSAEWTYHKGRSFASNFVFLKIFFQS